MKLVRPLCPPWLADIWEAKSRQWEAKLDNPNKSNDWSWYEHEGEKINKRLLQPLRDMTADHCAFCDGFPMKRIGKTVEHFKPKSTYPLEAYKWENLFLCCRNCQEKNDEFDEQLLKPDEFDYEFNRFFDYDFNTGFLNPNKWSSAADQQRAEITIRIYRLNEFEHPEDRLMTFRQYYDSNNPVIDEFSYRFILA